LAPAYIAFAKLKKARPAEQAQKYGVAAKIPEANQNKTG
jgi:hypothetical protein